jgi:hypothetical protein
VWQSYNHLPVASSKQLTEKQEQQKYVHTEQRKEQDKCNKKKESGK